MLPTDTVHCWLRTQVFAESSVTLNKSLPRAPRVPFSASPETDTQRRILPRTLHSASAATLYVICVGAWASLGVVHSHNVTPQ